MTYQKVISLHGDIPLARFGHTTTFVGNGKVLLFGGAVGDVGRYTITADLYLFDIHSCLWTRLHSDNTPPPRAAHAAACVESMQVVVFGGATGGGALSSDDLYLLDLRRDTNLSWIIVPTTGRSPGRRYGHSMVFSKPNLIVIGGNDGQQASIDVWLLNVETSPFTWVEVAFAPSIKKPPKRVYHSADICRDGPAATMTVIFGGRTSDSKSLNDVWGLRQHRDNTWDWVEAPVRPGVVPDSRYQHSASFVGSKLVIIGGRNDSEFNKPLSISVYDTETLGWINISSIHRFRHSCWGFGNLIYIFGGFSNQTQKHPTAEMRTLDCQAAFADYYKNALGENATLTRTVIKQPPVSGSQIPSSGVLNLHPNTPESLSFKAPEREIRLSSHAHAAHDSISDFSVLVRKVSIDRLEDEGRKINKPEARSKLHWQNESTDTVYDRVIHTLLNFDPMNSSAMQPIDGHFPVSWNDINALCQIVYQIVKNEDTVLVLRAPIKVYGDIHGQYHDLMRLFHLYKCPLDECLAEAFGSIGDLDSNDYLFLGDYVDRGSNSLEVICLLFALKCKYPTQVHLLRGNHEDPNINALYGFQDECKRRLREDPNNVYSCWQSINRVFEQLPLGALIEGRILCIHGGIGKTVNTIDDIRNIQRPVEVAALPQDERDQIILDILWSDPTDSDAILGTVPNEVRDPERIGHIVKFGPDRVHSFLTNNNLQLIIRAHECVMDGFERFAGGRLITLFSATNYCNHYKNAGALLFIRRDLTIVPKLIYPPSNTDVRQYNTWDMRMAELRPPTPPRSVPRIINAEWT